MSCFFFFLPCPGLTGSVFLSQGQTRSRCPHSQRPLVCVSHSVVSGSLRPCGLQPAPLSMGCSGQDSWSGLPSPPPGALPDPGIEPVFCVSELAGGLFTASTAWEAPEAPWMNETQGLLPFCVFSSQGGAHASVFL